MRLNHLFSQDFTTEALRKKSTLSIWSLRLTLLQNISQDFFFIVFFSGAHSGVATHVPFPNTAVKDPSGDGTVNSTMGE